MEEVDERPGDKGTRAVTLEGPDQHVVRAFRGDARTVGGRSWTPGTRIPTARRGCC